MTRDECTTFNETVNIPELRAYWGAVGDAVREVARSVPVAVLSEPVDQARLYQMLEDGSIGNERARWVPSFLEGKTKAGSCRWRSGTWRNICWVA